jgi:hypothetical protein
VPLTAWLAWVWSCEAKSALALDDPMPFVRSTLHRLVARGSGQQPEGLRQRDRTGA